VVWGLRARGVLPVLPLLLMLWTVKLFNCVFSSVQSYFKTTRQTAVSSQTAASCRPIDVNTRCRVHTDEQYCWKNNGWWLLFHIATALLLNKNTVNKQCDTVIHKRGTILGVYWLHLGQSMYWVFSVAEIVLCAMRCKNTVQFYSLTYLYWPYR